MSDEYTQTYLTPAIEPRMTVKIEKGLVDYIRNSGVEFETIAFRGMSGALMAPSVARKMRKELLMVRKEDGSHSCVTLEGFKQIRNYIIIDDFVSTGATVRAILEALSENVNFRQANCVAVFCYNSRSIGAQPETLRAKPSWSAPAQVEIPIFNMAMQRPFLLSRPRFEYSPSLKTTPPAPKPATEVMEVKVISDVLGRHKKKYDKANFCVYQEKIEPVGRPHPRVGQQRNSSAASA